MYQLPKLPYAYNSLEPYIDEKTMKLHHDKHHLSYVTNANLALEKISELRKKGDFSNLKPWLLSLSFNLSGHLLHSLFWEIMKPVKENQAIPKGLAADINANFGSLDRFYQEFSSVAMSVEGSGWASLVSEPSAKKLMVVPIEKHNLLSVQATKPILVLDVWEHAYYLKYQNDRQSYVNNFQHLINWQVVEEKLRRNQ